MKAHQAPRGEDLEEEGKNRVREKEMGWIEEERRGAGGRYSEEMGSPGSEQTAEKQTPHQSGQCGADTFHEVRHMIRKEAPSVLGAKDEQGYGAASDGYV